MDRVPDGIQPMLKDLEQHIMQAGLADMFASAEVITTVSLMFVLYHFAKKKKKKKKDQLLFFPAVFKWSPVQAWNKHFLKGEGYKPTKSEPFRPDPPPLTKNPFCGGVCILLYLVKKLFWDRSYIFWHFILTFSF